MINDYQICYDGFVFINGNSYESDKIPKKLIKELVIFLQDKKCDIINDIQYLKNCKSFKELK